MSAPAFRPLDAGDGIPAALQLYLRALHTCDGEALDQIWHEKALLLQLEDSGVAKRDAAEVREMVVSRAPSDTEEYTRHDRVLQVSVLSSNTAAAKVQVALPPGASEPSAPARLFTEWLALLVDPVIGRWQIISRVHASVALPRETASDMTHPPDYAGVVAAAWDVYRAASRATSGKGMAKVFHPVCNLTAISPQGLMVLDSDGFCERVENRWELDLHKPYFHLVNDPRIGQADSIMSVDFAGPDVAMVTIRIGAPPMLYTEFLSFLRLEKPVEGRGPAGWWIVAKTAAGSPSFLRGEARPRL